MRRPQKRAEGSCWVIVAFAPDITTKTKKTVSSSTKTSSDDRRRDGQKHLIPTRGQRVGGRAVAGVRGRRETLWSRMTRRGGTEGCQDWWRRRIRKRG